MSEERAVRRYTRLEESQWSQIEAEWSSGDVTLPELAEAHGVAIRTLQNRFSTRGILKGAPAGGFSYAADVSAHAETFQIEPIGATPDLAAEAAELRSRTTMHVRELTASLMNATRALTTDNTTRPAAAIRSLVAAASALERLHAIERTALGIDGNEHLSRDLPVLVLRDITEAEILEIQADPSKADDGDPPRSCRRRLPAATAGRE